MSRPRFKEARIASSDHYEWSLRYHRKYLLREHFKNIEIFSSITVTVKKRAFVKCFGKLVPITDEQAREFSKDMNIIWQ